MHTQIYTHMPVYLQIQTRFRCWQASWVRERVKDNGLGLWWESRVCSPARVTETAPLNQDRDGEKKAATQKEEFFRQKEPKADARNTLTSVRDRWSPQCLGLPDHVSWPSSMSQSPKFISWKAEASHLLADAFPHSHTAGHSFHSFCRLLFSC